jgi:hypothetical protein
VRRENLVGDEGANEMTAKEERNRLFLTKLFCGEFSGHAVICVPPLVSSVQAGDYAVSKEPVKVGFMGC